MHAPSLERFNRSVKSTPLLRWLFVTKEGEVVIGQMPNAPLVIAVVADVIAYATRGGVRTFGDWTAKAAFIMWSVLEIGWGLNPFRRIVGYSILALVVFSIVRKFASP